MFQAGTYSAVTHYLKAVEAAKTDDADKVIAKMKATKVNDFFAKDGEIGPDGRHRYDMYLMQVKSPKESTEPWDYFKLVQTIPGEQAYLPLAQSRCPLIKK